MTPSEMDFFRKVQSGFSGDFSLTDQGNILIVYREEAAEFSFPNCENAHIPRIAGDFVHKLKSTFGVLRPGALPFDIN